MIKRTSRVLNPRSIKRSTKKKGYPVNEMRFD